jgi:hypothetical protein
MSNVYFSSARTRRGNYSHSVPGKLEAILKKMDLSRQFKKDEWVATSFKVAS